MGQGGAQDGRDGESCPLRRQYAGARSANSVLVGGGAGRGGGGLQGAHASFIFQTVFSQRGEENSSPLVPSSLLSLSETPTTVRRRQGSPARNTDRLLCASPPVCVYSRVVVLAYCSVP